MSENWLSIVEYARKHDISDMTVRRRIKTGKINAVLKEGKYFIPEDHAHVVNPSTNHSPGKMNKSQSPKESSSPVRTRPLVIPTHLRASFSGNKTSESSEATLSNGSAALLNFCENALKRSEQAESRLGERYETQLSSLQERLSQKDATIDDLHQQVHDLQVLIQLMESEIPG